MTRVFVCFAVACAFVAAPVSAHHAAAVLGTVTITQPVVAGGTTLQPGTYEIRDTGEHPEPLPGQSDDAQAEIEFIANGTVVATDVAEVMPAAPRPVGTSGGATRARVERLRTDNFLRISLNREAERYLIHLPMAGN